MSDPEVQVIRVVRTTLLCRGNGRDEDDPMRRVTQFWSLDGELLAEDDKYAPTHCNAIGHRVDTVSLVCVRCYAKFGAVR